ncbi:MAG: Rrf2 family transcriptional regulator [Clostridia bacterium]|nr:Rrf2 family transcriptional regulator [Clostridia bacterium]
MKISTKGRYALRMMIDTAQHQDQGFVALKDIAERQNISKKYLEQIVLQLTQAGMLRASRGHQGGYKLTADPATYTVGQILRVVEGPLTPVACLDQTPNQCERCGFCLTLPVWEGLQEVVEAYLDGITLQNVIDGPETVKRVAGR